MPRKSEHDGKPGERIAKAMARAGLASRREAETWVAAGRVAVNGEVITSPAVKVGAKDRVTVDGKPLPQRERTRLYLFHKPRGLVTTNFDPEGRRTIFDVLPKDLPRLVTVGRLDFNTEGLLLLTNDGGLARVLEHPDTGWLRRYRVRAHGSVTQQELDALRDGITVDGIHYGPIEAKLDRPQGANVWITFAIREGKNREVRNVLRALNLDVNRLIRVSFGPFQLGELAEGAVEEVKTRVLREQIGKKIAAQAGADFDAPVVQQREEAPAQTRPPRLAEERGKERGKDRGKERDRRPPRGDDRRSRDYPGSAPSDRSRPARPARADSRGRDRPFEEQLRRPPRDDGDRYLRRPDAETDRSRPARPARADAHGRARPFEERLRRPPQDDGDRFRRRPDTETSKRGAPQDGGERPPKPRPWRGHGRDRPITEPAPENDKARKIKAGLVTDRKGRRVLVQRVQPEPSAEPPPPERPERPPRGRPHGRPAHGKPPRGKAPRDRRSSGPRPSRPRAPGEGRKR